MFKSLKAVITEKAKARVVLAILESSEAGHTAIVHARHTFIVKCNVVNAHIHRWS